MPKKISKDYFHQIYNSFKKNGYFMIENFFDKNELDLFRENFDYFLSLSEKVYPYHFVSDFLKSRVISLQDDNKYRNLFSIIEKNNFFLDFSKIYLKNKFYPAKFMLYETKGKKIDDYSSNKDHAFVPHTDETYFLKFFIYLTDVTTDHGPLNIAPGTHIESKKKRHDWIKNNNNYLNRNKIDRTHENSFIPLTANAGCLIIFDTDVVHKAGIIQNGKTRKVIRLDVYSKRENFNTLLQKIFLKFNKFKKKFKK